LVGLAEPTGIGLPDLPLASSPRPIIRALVIINDLLVDLILVVLVTPFVAPVADFDDAIFLQLGDVALGGSFAASRPLCESLLTCPAPVLIVDRFAAGITRLHPRARRCALYTHEGDFLQGAFDGWLPVIERARANPDIQAEFALFAICVLVALALGTGVNAFDVVRGKFLHFPPRSLYAGDPSPLGRRTLCFLAMRPTSVAEPRPTVRPISA
jgi:hypothetical protein